MTTPEWTDVATLEELADGALRTVRHESHQLVVGRTPDGGVFALDNRCPHEGYPLAQGDLKECTLTCAWHNWKFDVRDGSCEVGGEAVRAYPARAVDGQAQVDVAEPDPETFFSAWRDSFLEGIARHENGRAIRDGVRLVAGGFDPWKLLGEVALDDARRAEYGTTHVLAVAADSGRLLERYTGPSAMYAIAPAVDLCGETNKLRAQRVRPKPVLGADEASLRAAIEAEDAGRAEGLVLGAFAEGVPRSEVEGWILAALTDHFLNFGHRLIYMIKAQELIAHAGEEYAPEVYGSLVYAIVYGTREDTLPYMAAHAKRLTAAHDELRSLSKKEQRDEPLEHGARLREAVLDGRTEDAFDATLDALRSGSHPARVAEELVIAAGERLLRFDSSLDARADVAENWLWVTHRFTFTAAVRHALRRWQHPDAARLLFHAVMFLHTGRPIDLPPERRVSREGQSATVEDILGAVALRQPDSAVAYALGYLRDGGALEPLQHAVEDLCLADPVVRPIVVAHAIKTSAAAFEEYAALEGHPERVILIAAALRFLSSPLVERRVHETVATSIDWVVDGKMPKKLSQ